MRDCIAFYDPHRGRHRILANYAPHPVQARRCRYRTAEHAYQSLKFVGRQTIAARVRRAGGPDQAKTLARRESARRRASWDAVKVEVMRRVIWLRLREDRAFRRALMRTGLRPIVELTASDTFWGWSPEHGGQNQMGRILVDMRRRWRAGAPFDAGLTSDSGPGDRLFLQAVRGWL